MKENMIKVTGSKFIMGNIYGEGDLETDLPTYEVEVSDFYINKYLVTFDEYDEYCESDFDIGNYLENGEEHYGKRGKIKPYDNNWGRGKRPVINVSWEEALFFCNWLSKKEGLPPAYVVDFSSYQYSDDLKETYYKYFFNKAFDFEENYIFNFSFEDAYNYQYNFGNYLDENGKITLDTTKVKGYRLATDSEWEYVSKGGMLSKGYKYSGSNNPDDVAIYYDYIFPLNTRKVIEIGTKKPNELGLYDMSGNVSEFVQDFDYDFRTRISNGYPINPVQNIRHPEYIDGLRVCRSGNSLSNLRNSYRDGINEHKKDNSLGFRIAKSL